MSAHLGQVLAANVPTPERIQDAVQEVYARPEFGSSDQKSYDWLEQFLRQLFGGLGLTPWSSPFVFYFVLVALALLLLGLMGYVAWSARRVLLRNRWQDQRGKSAHRRAVLSQACWEEACKCEAAGEYTEAIRHLFLALVYRLDESGRVSFRQASTNHEYLEIFTDRPLVHGSMAEFVTTLDDHWYGQRPAERRQFERCLTLYHQLTHG